MAGFASHFARIVEFLANAITVVLGCAAIYAFFFKRKELSSALRGLTQMMFNHRMHRLKETLGRLDRLKYDDKDQRPEVMALIGELGGQLRSLTQEYPSLVSICGELTAIIERKKRVNEANKQRIVHELHGLLDDAMFGQQRTKFEKDT